MSQRFTNRQILGTAITGAARDRDGNRLFHPSSLSQAKIQSLTEDEQEIYLKSTEEYETRSHAEFERLQQQSIDNLARAERARTQEQAIRIQVGDDPDGAQLTAADVVAVDTVTRTVTETDPPKQPIIRPQEVVDSNSGHHGQTVPYSGYMLPGPNHRIHDSGTGNIDAYNHALAIVNSKSQEIINHAFYSIAQGKAGILEGPKTRESMMPSSYLARDRLVLGLEKDLNRVDREVRLLKSYGPNEENILSQIPSGGPNPLYDLAIFYLAVPEPGKHGIHLIRVEMGVNPLMLFSEWYQRIRDPANQIPAGTWDGFFLAYEIADPNTLEKIWCQISCADDYKGLLKHASVGNDIRLIIGKTEHMSLLIPDVTLRKIGGGNKRQIECQPGSIEYDGGPTISKKQRTGAMASSVDTISSGSAGNQAGMTKYTIADPSAAQHTSVKAGEESGGSHYGLPSSVEIDNGVVSVDDCFRRVMG